MNKEFSSLSLFQFHKGTIRTRILAVILIKFLDFNSIKVQLELWQFGICDSKRTKFQFHKGTIRTYASAKNMIAMAFQFHKGTIRTRHAESAKLLQLLFQFHKGTIRTFHREPTNHHALISIP